MRDLLTIILARKPKMCSFLEYKDSKVCYKRYECVEGIDIALFHLSEHPPHTLKEETFAERNFCDFREFWANSRKLFLRKILQRLIRESFFSRKKYEKQ